MITTIHLLRHAENAPDLSVPDTEWPLSDRGRQQALDLVPVLSRLGIEHVWSSPFPRSIDTARPFGNASGLKINLHNDLRERKLSEKLVPDWRALLRRTWEDFQFAGPGGESSSACQTRVRRAVHDLAVAHAGSTLLLVSHGNALALYLNSIDSSFGFDGWATMKNPDLFRVVVSGDTHSWDRGWKYTL